MDILKKNQNIIKVAAATAAIYAAFKIYPLTQSAHCILQERREPRPIDSSIYPQYFANKQGLWMYTRSWVVKQPKAAIFICHGLGEHIGRYEHVARFFNAHGYSVYGMDHQGHGQSDGDRGYTDNFQHFVDDYAQFVSTVDSSVPRFLYGHSMGGLISTMLSIQHHSLWAGVIISAPALIPDPEIATPFKMALVKKLSALLPKVTLDALDSAGMTANQTVVERYSRDRLNYAGGLPIRLVYCLLDAMGKATADVHKITVPLFCIHGEIDPICSVEGTHLLHSKASSADKSVKIYPGLLHEPHNEGIHLDVLGDIVAWIQGRC